MASTEGVNLARRSLGRKGLEPTVLGLGTAQLGDLFQRLPEHQADEVVQKALRCGITLFDTAPWYGHGLSEHRVGRGLRQVERERVIVSTKVGRVYRRPGNLQAFSTGIWAGGLHFELRFDYSGAGILRSYEDSLLRLGLNRVDCLVIHDLESTYHTAVELDRHRAALEASGWAALEALRDQEEIAAIGAGVMERSTMGYFLDRFDVDFFLVAMPYTLLDQAPLREELTECHARGIRVIIGSPYASGILATGAVAGALYNYSPATSAVLEKARRLEAVCAEFGISLQAAALQFPLAHPAVTAVIPGATSPEIVAANVANVGVNIPADLWETLRAQGLLLPDAAFAAGVR
jgi:D-threo-aldose 1-dehydrogenase